MTDKSMKPLDMIAKCVREMCEAFEGEKDKYVQDISCLIQKIGIGTEDLEMLRYRIRRLLEGSLSQWVFMERIKDIVLMDSDYPRREDSIKSEEGQGFSTLFPLIVVYFYNKKGL